MKMIKRGIQFASVLRNHPRDIPRYSLYQLKSVCMGINKRYHKLRGLKEYHNLMTADWDTAIILDACRYNTFESCHEFDQGHLSKITSPGASSAEFIRRTFQSDQFHDTVYVGGNPYITILDEETFHAVQLDDMWDENTTAHPETTTEMAREMHQRYPQKRIIVHYMQPHLPIVHPDYEHLNNCIDYMFGAYWPARTDVDSLVEAYRMNFKYVCEFVKKLLEDVIGKVIITADHGELLGDRQSPLPIRGFSHHEALYVPELIEVPWYEIPVTERRDVVAEPPKNTIDVDEETKEKRLKALGYL